MTLAIDKVTDKVLGQVVQRVRDDTPQTPISGERLSILTADGYKTIVAASVRLEEAR